MICKKEKKEIRKAYFSGKLKELLNEIQEDEQIKEKELLKLKEYLEELKKEDKDNVQKLGVFNDDPPSVEELMSNENVEAINKHEDETNEVINTIKTFMWTSAKMIGNGEEVTTQTLMDKAHEFTLLRGILQKDVRYKEVMFYRKLIAIMDGYEISRKEAEDRAKITQEYLDYKNSKDFFEQVEDFVINSRKSYNNYN